MREVDSDHIIFERVKAGPSGTDPIRKAAGIIDVNMHEGRIPDNGFQLLVCVSYDDIGGERARAELKSRFRSRLAADVIRHDHPALPHQARLSRSRAIHGAASDSSSPAPRR